MSVYPVNLDMAGKSCAVIGGGSVAERKIRALLQAGARITVFSPEITTPLAELIQEGQIEYIARAYRQGDLSGFFMAICTTDNPQVNQAAAAEARRRGMLLNVADAPELGNFTVPARIQHGDLLITVSTGGKSPALAKKLREELQQRYGPEYGLYLEMVAKLRQQIKQSLSETKEREAFWRQNLDDEILSLLKEGKITEAEDRIKHATGCFGGKS